MLMRERETVASLRRADISLEISLQCQKTRQTGSISK